MASAFVTRLESIDWLQGVISWLPIDAAVLSVSALANPSNSSN